RREGRDAGAPARHGGRHAVRAAEGDSGLSPDGRAHDLGRENTGALDAMLSKIADFYDDEVDAAVTALTSLLEPMMIVFLGVVVGGIVVAMYLPIFKLVTIMK